MADAPDRLKISMEGVASAYKKSEQAARGMLKAFGEQVKAGDKISSALAKQLVLEGNLTNALKKKFPISQQEIHNLKAKGFKTHEIITIIQKYIETEKKSASQQKKMLDLQHQAILEDKKRTEAINKTKAARKLSIDKLIQELKLNGINVTSIQKEIKWKTLRKKVIDGNKLALIELNKRVKDHIRSTKSNTQHIHQQVRGFKELAFAMAGVNKQGAFAVRNNRNIGGTFSVLRSKLLLASFAFGMVNRSIIELAKIQGRQVEAENKVAQAIVATGAAAGLTGNEIKKYAQDLQSITTFGDEAILSSSALLLSFKRIGKEAFLPAQKAILNVSAAMNVDLKTATIQIGKALNAPINGLAALNRVGIQFSEMQKRDLKKALLVANSDLEAQTIILDELQRQFGGMAEIMSMSTLGSIDKMQNALGDLAEVVADNLAPSIIAITQSIKEFAETVDPERVKVYISQIINLAAAFAMMGPAMKIANFLIKGLNKGLKTTIVLQNLLRKAFLKSGIGVLLFGVAAAVQAFIKLKFAVTDSEDVINSHMTSLAKWKKSILDIASEKGLIGLTGELERLNAKLKENANSALYDSMIAGSKFYGMTKDQINEALKEENAIIKAQILHVSGLLQVQTQWNHLTEETQAILAKMTDTRRQNEEANKRTNLQIERTIALANPVNKSISEISDEFKENTISMDNNLLALKKFGAGYEALDVEQKKVIDNLSRQSYEQWQTVTALKKEAELRSSIAKTQTETKVFKEQFNIKNIADRIKFGFALSVQDKQRIESMKREIELLGLTAEQTKTLQDQIEKRIEGEAKLADLEAAKGQAMSIMSDLKEMQFARDIEMADQAIEKANEVMEADIEAVKKSSAYKLAQAVGDTKRMKKLEDDARAKSLPDRQAAFKDKQKTQIGHVQMESVLAMIKAISDFGWLIGGGISLLIGAQTQSSIATIKQQQPPTMETGGLIGGRSHSQGGTIIEAEKGEFVMRRSAVESIGTEALNRMNSTGGAGSNVTVNISGNVMSSDYVEGELAEQIKDAVRRGTDFGIV
tara:strand:- start:11378 stop:14503 length:3126 start_codon:yes stop_codon:yes gene_type:complete